MAARAPKISAKRVAISRANAEMVIIVGIASFITVFCLVAAQAVLSQDKYQSRVISAKNKANTQLKSDVSSFSDLESSYQNFVDSPTNVIGGSLSGTGQNDGSNAKIVLDALPNSYDFPALATSIQALITAQNLQAASISGTDDQLNQQSNTVSQAPTPVMIPFSFSISDASYVSVQKLILALQNSVRPIQVDTLSLSGSSTDMSVNVTAHTFYQPGKSLSITETVVK
jgi:hypothetical protein